MKYNQFKSKFYESFNKISVDKEFWGGFVGRLGSGIFVRTHLYAGP